MRNIIKNKKLISAVTVVAVLLLAAVGFFAYKNAAPYEKKSITDFAMGTLVTVTTYDSKYDENVEQALDFLKGGSSKSLKQLTVWLPALA